MSSARRFVSLLLSVAAIVPSASCGGDSTSPSAPASPSAVTATPGDGRITVSWEAATGATSYDLYWSDLPGVAGTSSSTRVSGVASPYTVGDLTPLQSYYFVVTANHPTGGTGYSNEVTASPSGVVATGSNQAITVSWSPVPGATSYNIYWSTVPGITPATGTKIAGATSPYLHSGLTNGVLHYYLVTPVTGGVEGAPMSQALAAPYADPTAVAWLIATAGDGRVTLNWEKHLDCCTSSYNVYWSTSPSMTGATKIAGAHNAFVHNALANGTTYYYMVTAADINGFGEGSVSPIASATPAP